MVSKAPLKDYLAKLAELSIVMPLTSEFINNADLKNELMFDSAYTEINAESDFSALPAKATTCFS